MSWQIQGTRYTDPTYYRDAADRVEAQLRADFAAHHQLREIAAHGETPAHVVEYAARAHDLARAWRYSASPGHRHLWQQLSIAVESWTANPESARVEFGRLQQSFIEGNPAVESTTVRTQRQAAEITGHLEPVQDYSAQDGARYRPRHLSAVPDLGADGARRLGAADRALGGRGPDLLDLDEIQQIIDATDDLLAIEEAAGDRDTGADELEALIPAEQRNAPVIFDYTRTFDQHKTQIAAVRRVQDLAAEHLRLAGEFDGTAEGGQVLIERLETLMDATRRARREAVSAGVGEHDISAAYRAGLTGQFWSQQPGVPHLGQLDQILGERDHALAEIDTLRAEFGPDAYPRPGLALAVGAEPAFLPLSYTPSTATPTDPGGAAIADAVDAALPETGFASAWSTPEVTGVIDAPRHEPAVEHHL
ncbi:hypothetical protein [Nocardia rhizosphaerihabitans]|uniref:Uncharacterized protein n=1 Tax=Nocardia rhizosphaerihabitans TaxID=1691570 RepID=A0ABQ2K4B0_9NOCA|nr:hypothetical protein [Nocardia rhizosphaerihabitans]GGN66062.1 hypothetical protein GCM10011610_00610 [Nocardia rhizosphaerihabitans]